MKDLLINIFVRILDLWHKILQYSRPSKLVLVTDKEFQAGIQKFSQEMIEARLKQLETSNAILSYKVLNAMEENTISINALRCGQEELLHMFNPEGIESESELESISNLFNTPTLVKNEIN